MFNRDPTVLGRGIDVNGQRLTVVGVARPEFSGLDDTPYDLWVPITMYGPLAKADLFGASQPREIGIVARVRHGVPVPQIEGALTPFMARVVDRRDAVRAEARWLATPNPLTWEMLAMLSPIFAAFLLVLVAASANVSNVMLARANARHREIAMRLSLGASRGRVVRQLMTEGLLIAALAGAAGLAVAVLTLRAGMAAFFAGLPSSIVALVRVAPLDLDHRVFAFVLALAAAATLIFALVPALQSTRMTLTHALRGQAGGSARKSALRNALVVSQVTVSLVLLVVAATLVRNGITIGGSDLGFDTRGVISVKPRRTSEAQIAHAAEVLKRDPRVDAVAAASRNPLSEQLPRMPLIPSPGAAVVATSYKFVSPEYFSILRIPILHGRGFTTAEAGAEAPVAIVSAAAARTLWPGADPIGRTLKVRIEPLDVQRADTTQVERPAGDASGTQVFEVVVVGVARDVISGLMADGVDPSHLYLPTSPTGPHAANLLVHARSSQDLRLDRVQALLQQVDADPLAAEVLPLEELREAQMFPVKAASWIGSLLGLVALALSVSGLYGVLTYTLSQRTREIGIRMALGATGTAVVRLVMGQSARLAGIGAGIGIVIAFGVLKVLSAAIQLQNVSVLDAGAFLVALGLVAGATALAAFVPARRATRVDPAETLRAEG
jgi:predicted permease